MLTNAIRVTGKDNAQKYTFAIKKLLMKILVKYNFGGKGIQTQILKNRSKGNAILRYLICSRYTTVTTKVNTGTYGG